MLIAVLAVSPFPQASRTLTSIDKLLHLCEYFLLTWCLTQTVRASHPLRTTTLVGVFLASAGYGALLEAVQAWLPWRRAEWTDLMANTVGAGLGFLLGCWRMRS